LGTLLDLYESASGQMVNRQKTSLFFSKNTLLTIRTEIQQFWGVSSSCDIDTYLGMPAFIGRNKGLAFRKIKEQLIKRLEGWNERFLFKAGREVLIKAVAKAIPSYTMSCFLLPRRWCEDLNAIVTKYWWGSIGLSKKIHWLKWSHLCKPKEEGGLGF
jgi:hypothetical protein